MRDNAQGRGFDVPKNDEKTHISRNGARARTYYVGAFPGTPAAAASPKESRSPRAQPPQYPGRGLTTSAASPGKVRRQPLITRYAMVCECVGLRGLGGWGGPGVGGPKTMWARFGSSPVGLEVARRPSCSCRPDPYIFCREYEALIVLQNSWKC